VIPNATRAVDVPDAVKANVTFSVSRHTELTATHTHAWVSVILFFLNLGRSSRGGRQKLILEIIALMVHHPSGSHQQSSYYYYYFLTPVLNSRGMKKLRYAIQKSTKIKLE